MSIDDAASFRKARSAEADPPCGALGPGLESRVSRRQTGDTMALAAMRRHRRWLYAFLWIVIAGFILFYVPQFQGAGGASGTPGEIVATVGGLPITVGEYQKAYQRIYRQYEAAFQG